MVRSLSMSVVCAWFCLAAAILSGTGCGSSTPLPAASIEAGSEETVKAAQTTTVSSATKLPETIDYSAQPSIYGGGEQSPVPNPVVVIHTSAGDITVELFLEQAPNTVSNFLDNYVRQGFYDGTIFHHVDPEGIVVGGGYTQEMQLKPTRGALFNESANGLTHVRGTLGMFRDLEDAHSATSQFFFNVVDNPGLNYQGDATAAERGYCVFGKVIEGMEVVDKLAAAPLAPQQDFDHLPSEVAVIQSVEQTR